MQSIAVVTCSVFATGIFGICFCVATSVAIREFHRRQMAERDTLTTRRLAVDEKSRLEREVDLAQDREQCLLMELRIADVRWADETNRSQEAESALRTANRLYGSERAAHLALWNTADANAKELGEERKGRERYQAAFDQLRTSYQAIYIELQGATNKNKQLELYIKLLKTTAAIVGHLPPSG